MRYLVFDMSNILHKTFYAHPKEDDIILGGIAAHSGLTTLNKYFNLYKPDKIIMAFDRPSWRLNYTKSSECVSGLVYKGGRRLNQTPEEELRYKTFKQHVNEFELLVTENTTAIVLAEMGLEADDLISGCAQLLTLMDDDNEVIIVSADKDFMQLLRYDGVHLIDPATGLERTLADHNNDAEYFMFEKCFRGEGKGGDNVQSAYPRIRATKILEAYNDPFVRTTVMKHEWTRPAVGERPERKFVVEELFAENQILMDLEKQPAHIEKQIITSVRAGLKKKKKFDYVKFLKFCGQHDLKKIADASDRYLKMLSL